MLTEVLCMLAFCVIVILVEFIWHYSMYDLIDAVCVEFTSSRGGYQGQKYYPATYEYEIDGEKYSTYAEAIWKPKVDVPCKLFVGKKNRNKIVPYTSVMKIVWLCVFACVLGMIALIGGIAVGYYPELW